MGEDNGMNKEGTDDLIAQVSKALCYGKVRGGK